MALWYGATHATPNSRACSMSASHSSSARFSTNAMRFFWDADVFAIIIGKVWRDSRHPKLSGMLHVGVALLICTLLHERNAFFLGCRCLCNNYWQGMARLTPPPRTQCRFWDADVVLCAVFAIDLVFVIIIGKLLLWHYGMARLTPLPPTHQNSAAPPQTPWHAPCRRRTPHLHASPRMQCPAASHSPRPTSQRHTRRRPS